MGKDSVNLATLKGVIIGKSRSTGEVGAVIETDKKHLPKVLEKLKNQRTQVVGAGKIVYESRLDYYLWDLSHLD